MDRLVRIAYLGGTHGAFVQYFVDKFSKLTPNITQSPFLSNGTSHNLDVKYSGKVPRWTFEDNDGVPKNDYKLLHPGEPTIIIVVDENAVFNFTRTLFIRSDDHEYKGTGIVQSNNKIILSAKFIQMYGKKLKDIYQYDIVDSTCPKMIIRDFLKLSFQNLQNNQSLNASKSILENAHKNTVCINLSEIWDTEQFMRKMREASDKFKLDLEISDDAYNLHKEFLEKRFLHKTFTRVYEVIDSIKNEKYFDCADLDIVEQAYLANWIEKNYDFVQMPITNNFFNDTYEILEYVKLYPNHYKAMNPNLPKFNNIPNPFYLWNNKK